MIFIDAGSSYISQDGSCYLVLHEQIVFPPALSVSKAKTVNWVAQLTISTVSPVSLRVSLQDGNVWWPGETECQFGGMNSGAPGFGETHEAGCIQLNHGARYRIAKCRKKNIPATGAQKKLLFKLTFCGFYREDWVVATQIFLEFSPRKLGKVPILTSILFKGVETTN